MKRVWNYVSTMWQPVSAFIAGSLVLICLFSYHAGSLVAGSAKVELATSANSQSLSKIADNPINAPYKLGQFVLGHIHKSITTERLLSGFIAGLSVILFYIVARRFCSEYASLGASLLYATSSSLLHSGRLAAPEISLLLLFLLLACGYYLRFNRHSKRAWILAAIVLGLSLYTPGMIYFVILVGAWQYRSIIRSRDQPMRALMAVCAAIVLVLLVPLILGLIHTHGLWRAYLGLPATFPSVMEFLRRILAVPAGIFIYAPSNPLYRLGHQPMLDIFAAFMFIVGCYYLGKHYSLDRLKVLAGIFAVGVVFTALSGNYENSLMLLPFIYLIAGMGISFLQLEWNKVFPHNPLARWLAVVVLSIAVIVSCNFQTRRYFIAWPHNAATKSVFTLK